LGGTCSTHGRDEKGIHFSRKFEGNTGHLGDLGVYGRIILKWMAKKEYAVVYLVYLDQVRPNVELEWTRQ
jgi:hypothetical protein